MNFCRLRPTVGNRDPYTDIVPIGLGVLHKHVKVAVFIEYTGINQLEFRFTL